MPRPGTTLTRSETRTSRSAPTGTGPWFVVGPTGTPDTDTTEGWRTPVKNLAEYAARFGSRASHVNDGGGGAAALYDQADAYFDEEGAEMYVSPATFNATPATYEINIGLALAMFAKDLGPGQVSVPGRSTPATKLALAVHGEANNRLAIMKTTNTSTVGTLTGEATIASITPNQERYCALFGPDVIIPPIVPGGATRQIGPEAIVAGLMSRNDGRHIVQNQPSAGELGLSASSLSTTFNFIDTDRTTLNVNGVNLLRTMYGGVRLYGYRSLADPSTDDNWVNLANVRLFMAIQALAEIIMERYVFRQLDGQRKTVTEFGGELTGMLLPFWQSGALYGATPSEAFRVDVGPNVNTDATAQARQLCANIILRLSEFAEEVKLELVKTRPTEVV